MLLLVRGCAWKADEDAIGARRRNGIIMVLLQKRKSFGSKYKSESHEMLAALVKGMKLIQIEGRHLGSNFQILPYRTSTAVPRFVDSANEEKQTPICFVNRLATVKVVTTTRGNIHETQGDQTVST